MLTLSHYHGQADESEVVPHDSSLTSKNEESIDAHLGLRLVILFTDIEQGDTASDGLALRL